ncbi:hypothetical protein CSPAE12_04932 [Colletotrichum incanum]|nr:hypothetical protein CSPAE12_04932 [Colletotrichum incanum]
METNTLKAAVSPTASQEPAPEMRPKVSPYASTSCKVYFQSGQQFRVPLDLLSGDLFKEIERKRNSCPEVNLRHVPDEAGHDEDWLDATKHASHLEICLHVYAIAQTYKLSGLAEFAETNISHYARAVPALAALLLASDACRRLGEEDAWISAFTKLRLRQLFDDPASLDKTGFLGCFESATAYSKMLVKHVVEICCEKSTSFYQFESLPTPQTKPVPTAGLEGRYCSMPPSLMEDPWLSFVSKDKKKKKGKKVARSSIEFEPVPEIGMEDEPVQPTELDPVEAKKDGIPDGWWWPQTNTTKDKKKRKGEVPSVDPDSENL